MINYINNKNFSKLSSEIIKQRVRGWEHLLLVQQFEEEIDIIDIWRASKVPNKEFFKKNSIKNFSDLTEYFNEVVSIPKMVIEFTNVFKKFNNDETNRNTGGDGDPIIIQMIARDISRDYLKFIQLIDNVKNQITELSIFIERNSDDKSEKFTLLYTTILLALKFSEESGYLLIAGIRRYISFIRDKISTVEKISDDRKNKVELKFSISLADSSKFLQAANNAKSSIKSLNKNKNKKSEFIEINKLTKDKVLDNPLRKLSEKISVFEKYKISELRDALLPLDYFPSAYIDLINEESINLFGETAIEEGKNEIFINRFLMGKILESTTLFMPELRPMKETKDSF